MTPDVRDQMFAHALAGLPNEACGMFSTAQNVPVVDQFHAMRNAAASPVIFELDGKEMLDLEREVEAAGRSLNGVMHSHTNTSAYPSPTDVRDSARFDPSGTFHHVIVSLRQSEPVLRCFTIMGEVITEVPVVLVDDTRNTSDGSGSAAAAVALLPPRD